MQEAEIISTTFAMDFGIAEVFGPDAIRDTFKRSFDSFSDNIEYMVALTYTLNHLLWYHYEKGNRAVAKIYNDLWEAANDYCWSHFTKPEEQSYIFHTLD